MSEKMDFVNYTLRLPEEYRRRLENEAAARGRSLNQQILKALELYFAESGYASEVINSAGVLFQVKTALAHEGKEESACEFSVENFHTEKEEAIYLIGLHRTLLRDLHVQDAEQACKEVGLALLSLHSRRGRDVRTLGWTQFTDNPAKRIVFGSEVPTKIETLPDFLEVVSKGAWTDHFLISDDEQEAISTIALTSLMEKSAIIKHMSDPEGVWVQIGSKKFNSADRDRYVKALTRMKLLRLVALEPMNDSSFNTYVLTHYARHYLSSLGAPAVISYGRFA
jgi:hypothetical protein